jgi:hypothetical protein
LLPPNTEADEAEHQHDDDEWAKGLDVPEEADGTPDFVPDEEPDDPVPEPSAP